MLLFAALVLIITSAFGSELCKEKEWYNDMTGNCHPCTVCAGKSWELSPCVEFADTMCVNLIEIGRSLQKKIEIDQKRSQDSNHPHKWHEMEGNDQSVSGVFTKEKISVSHTDFDEVESMWNQVILISLSVGFLLVVVGIVLMMMRYCVKIGNRNENRKTVNRARLFSRDRLNTTEYMKNLATLDRRLAIDEILEKRKRAIFEPQLLHENVYTDDVFVDVSRIPQSARDSHEYEELDHRKCLLQMQDHQ
ncbi:TNFR-Cys domain-containing protein [Caerostris extrusa]|uniref:TNFR-Cys domain-containing protein n=1 Tax=Caerostris extrusa TaxID=172846 RepID=A0AAV4XI94_CAEEX|nr:TNFR-Cys domain-containing protein [Caerostris extrusa]